MRALSDIMLSQGTFHVEVFHGETITVLDGALAGREFVAVKEIEADQVFVSELGEDRRAKRVLRFRDDGEVPALISQTRIRTADGKVWLATRAQQDGYLTTDFDLQEVTEKDH